MYRAFPDGSLNWPVTLTFRLTAIYVNDLAGLAKSVAIGHAARMYDSFEAIRADIAKRLGEAVSDRKSPMHTPVVATADADARVMVLRGWDAESGTLRFHTDARAPKCAVIGSGAPVGVVFYDKEAKIQLRLHGTGRIETNSAAADRAWEESSNFSRRCYLGEGPGAVSDEPTSGLPDWAEGEEPSNRELSPARENFAILLVDVQTMDWFHLANTGHRRALLTADGGQWIAP